ncbi:MAG: ATP-binding protein [Pseudomonas sp.]|uniref:ATP-binding protein n=1 Tax=Pseudomonas sp. TaxID=306 RepID=UPI0027334AD4|nr:ATP-binding protein [Pseudomonas sp.]MDP3846238.1 ATP-binding protein [Pseudomonas sp.]
MPTSPPTSVADPRTWPLLAILVSSFSLVATIPVLAIGLLFSLYYEPLMRRDVEAKQLNAAQATAQQIEYHFGVVNRELGSLAQLFINAQLLSQDEIEALLDAYAESSNFYEALYLTDEFGQISATGLPASKRSLRQNLLGLDISARDFVLQAHRRNQVSWSNSYLSTVSSRLTVALAQPVGRRTLVGEVAIEQLPELARQLSQNGALQIRLLDRQNQLVANSANSQDGQQPNLGNLAVLQKNQGSSSHFQLDGQALVGVAFKINGPDWQVLVAQPTAQAYANIDIAWQRIRFTLGLALLVALLIAGLTSWALAKKISLFTAHVEAIAQGRYDLPLIPSGIKELGRLQNSLQQMVMAICEREQAMRDSEQHLRDSEDRLLATLENAPNVAVQWFDLQGRVLLWNHASESLYAIERQDALGKTLDQLIFSPEQQHLFLANLREAANGIALGPYLLKLQGLDGQPLYLLTTTFSIPAPGGGQHFVCMSIDVSEQKKAEQAYRELNNSLEQRVSQRTQALSQSNQELNGALANLQQAQHGLVQSEKLAALGSLVAGIAHELNTPIGNSVMAASTLQDHTKAMLSAVTEGALRRSMLDQFVADSQTTCDILNRNLRRASELISSFKQVAVDQTGAQRRSFQLTEVVNEIIITLGPSLKKTPFLLESHIDGSLWLDSYPGALGQILVNLINNAVLHAFADRDHGLIVLRAYASQPGWLELTVTDNGSGISAEHLPRIYDPFFTTKLGQGGSGLGLNIVHNLATGTLGGRLEVASQVNWGTRFTLALPLCAPTATTSIDKQLAQSAATNNSPPPPAPAADSGSAAGPVV